MAFFGRRRFCIASGRLSPAREDKECLSDWRRRRIKHLFGESCHFTSTGFGLNSVPSGVGAEGLFQARPLGLAPFLVWDFGTSFFGFRSNFGFRVSDFQAKRRRSVIVVK